MILPLSLCLQVVVGGLNAYVDLADPANFADGVATGRMGLYTHGNGVIDEGRGGINIQVGQAWKSTAPGVAEFGVYAPGFFSTSYAGLWVGNGLVVSEANVDVDYTDPSFLASFEAFVDEGRSVGQIPNFAPILSPSSTSLYDGTQASLGTGFFDPKWDAVRIASAYGGGIAIDTPPLFVAYSPPYYLSFVEQEIRWANSAGLRTSVIISPYGEGPAFLANTQAYVRQLVADHAIPSQWVVENYAVNPDGTYPDDADYPNPIGSETTPGTVAQVADWLAHNAPVAAPDQGTTAIRTLNGIPVPVVTAPSTDGGWFVNDAGGAVSAIDVGAPDGSYLVEVTLDLKVHLYLYAADGALTASYSFPP
jgi:hypothetical protein